ncbi:sulfatase-like hydrolase/transferase [Pontiella desulfatans]|nr:sulfatase-like hydrolase/transferase [Pontiella desulfatans]
MALLLVASSAWAVAPNIVLILADDLGWNSVGWHNPDGVKTPNLDRLCREGLELDNFYVSPMCSPTRAGLLTGRYPIRYGCARAVIPPWRDFGLPVDETTLADALAEAGYEKRGVFGKWHLGHAQTKWHPNNRGFTDFIGCYNGAIDYFTHERDDELDWHRNGESLREEGYATTLIGGHASEFIRDAAKGDAPYFCYVPFNAPHSPFQVPEEYRAPYARFKDKKKQTYLAMISAMDEAVGEILETIEATGEAENTIVWFLSDNGAEGGISGGNSPLNGAKLSAYEGGVRVPACVRYPADYPGGRKLSARMAFIDVMPTLLRLAGVEQPVKPFDGIDLNPLLSGKTDRLPARDLYIYHGQQGSDKERNAVISWEWKLVVNGPDVLGGRVGAQKIELFHIASDPNESKDVAAEHPETVEELFAKLVLFRKLQPQNAVPPYKEGREGFVAPEDWKISM